MKIAVLLLLSAMAASARVGETIEETRKRFENPPEFTETSTPKVLTATFKKGEFTIQAWAVDGTISKETYSKVTQAQARAIRDKVSAKWELQQSQHELTCWRAGKNLCATWYNSDLTISDGRADSLVAAEEKAKVAKSVEGL